MNIDGLLPIRSQTFEYLRLNNFIYVDKTKYIYNIINGKSFSLSRPRRFGKSLLVSTIKSLFEGRKDLFKGLWIEASDYNWKTHPVLHFDMTLSSDFTLDGLKESLKLRIQSTARHYGIEVDDTKSVDYQLEEFIQDTSLKFDRVVILVDEYDNPIHSILDNESMLVEIHEFLSKFYSTVKKMENHIRFCFFTGITRFSKTSIFSGMNSLFDISLHENYSAILGYTQAEIENNYDFLIDKICKEKQLNKKSVMKKVKKWYNGYLFSFDNNSDSVYNPFSIILFIANKCSFDNYWFDTGNPTYLYNLCQKRNIFIEDFEGVVISKGSLKNPSNLNDLNMTSLLFESGYLWISSYNNKTEEVILDFPNYEVRSSFIKHYLNWLTKKEENVFYTISRNAVIYLKEENIDAFIAEVKRFFLEIPYPLQDHSLEKHYHAIFYIFLAMLGFNVKTEAEVMTSRGRIDLTIETKKLICICELKMTGTPDDALMQIHKRGYYQKFLSKNKKIILLGIVFNRRFRLN